VLRLDSSALLVPHLAAAYGLGLTLTNREGRRHDRLKEAAEGGSQVASFLIAIGGKPALLAVMLEHALQLVFGVEDHEPTVSG
jgi:hypothetical protein